MDINGSVIEIGKRKTKKYQVTLVYLRDHMLQQHRMNEDENDDLDDAHAYRYEVFARSLKEAIDLAQEMDFVVKAEAMSNYPQILPEGQFTKETVKEFAEWLEDKQMIARWLLVNPTSIQASLIKDEETLNVLTEDNVIKHMKSMPDDIEDFLKNREEE